jgi:uncharacterized membrane protein
MNKWLQILVGLILLVGGIYVGWGLNFWQFGDAALTVFKGGLMWAVLFLGLILVILGINNLKD